MNKKCKKPIQATIQVRTPEVHIIEKAMKTEIESSPYQKTTTTLTADDKVLVITIETEDMRALRGTFNSYMNWLITILESLSLQ